MKPAEIHWRSGNNEDLHAAARFFQPDGTGYDLTVYTAIAMVVRPAEFSPHESIRLTLGAGLSTYASTGQSVVNTLEFFESVSDPDSEISSLFGEHFYDAVGTRADGKTERFIFGTITFEQGKTYDLPA